MSCTIPFGDGLLDDLQCSSSSSTLTHGIWHSGGTFIARKRFFLIIVFSTMSKICRGLADEASTWLQGEKSYLDAICLYIWLRLVCFFFQFFFFHHQPRLVRSRNNQCQNVQARCWNQTMWWALPQGWYYQTELPPQEVTRSLIHDESPLLLSTNHILASPR
jgi:hypothetical protein